MATKIENNNTSLRNLIDDIEALPDYLDTADGTVAANDIVQGKVAYSNSSRIIGTMKNAEDVTF